MRILVTRAQADSMVLKAHLIAQGHEVLIAPLIATAPLPVDDVELDGAQALIATSRNAVRALASHPAIETAREIPIYVVGPGTAAAARALGFAHVIEGPRNAEALIALIALQAEVNEGPLIHLAGNVKAVDLGGELRRLGFHIQEPIVYATTLADRLPAAIAARIAAGEVAGVMLFSPQTARTWVRLLTRHDLARKARDIRHFCLSAAVAAALDPLSTTKVEIAVRPSLQEMLALTARTAPQSK